MFIFKSNLTAENFLKNLDNPFAKGYLEEINEKCEKFRNTPIKELDFSKLKLFEETGDRLTYESVYFERRDRHACFMLRTWLFHEEEDIRELENILWSMCDEYSWALPAHFATKLDDDCSEKNRERVDLFAAETAATIAETLSLCGEFLSSAVTFRCRNEVFSRVLEPVEKETQGWEYCDGNWPAVCGGSVGMAALYLIKDEKCLRDIIKRTKNACNQFVKTAADDGSYSEGLSYWNYAMKCYVPFDALLCERLGETVVEDKEKFAKLANFPVSICLTKDIAYSYSDSGSKGALLFGTFCKLHADYGISIPEKEYFRSMLSADIKLCSAVRTLAWFNPALLSDSADKKDTFYSECQMSMTYRGGNVLAIKGGTNAEPHNHNDVGAYMYIKDNEIIAEELASPVYTKQYFSLERYSYLNACSRGHNLPVINGCVQSEGAGYAADMFEKTDDGARVSFAKAYPEDAALSELIRDARVTEEGLRVCDRFKFAKDGNKITERILTKFHAEKDDERVVISSDGIQKAVITAPNADAVNIFISDPQKDGAQRDGSTVTIIEFEYNIDSNSTEIIYTIE